MNEGARQYFNPVPPTESATPGIGVTCLGTSVTARVYDLAQYPAMFGKILELFVSTGTVWISTSSDGATAIDKTLAIGPDGDANAIGEGTAKANPIPISSGMAFQMRLSKKQSRYLHVQADSGTPTLFIRPASQGKWIGSSAPDGT